MPFPFDGRLRPCKGDRNYTMENKQGMTFGGRLIKTTNQIERLSKDLGAMDSLNRQRIKDISQFVLRETDRQT